MGRGVLKPDVGGRSFCCHSQPARQTSVDESFLQPRRRSGSLHACAVCRHARTCLATPPTHAPLGLPTCPDPDDEALARELDAELNAGRRARHRPAYYGEQRGGGAGGGGEEDEDEWRDDGEVGGGVGRMRSGRLDARICD